MLKKVVKVVINHRNHFKMKLFQSFDVILTKKSMRVVIRILAMAFIFSNSIIVILYGVQKHSTIVSTIQDRLKIFTLHFFVFVFVFSSTYLFAFIHFIYILFFSSFLLSMFVFNCDLMFLRLRNSFLFFISKHTLI